MQHYDYSQDDPYEREPLESSRIPRDAPSRHPLASNNDYYSQPEPSVAYADASRQYRSPSRDPRGAYGDRSQGQSPYDHHGASYRAPPSDAPVPPAHGGNGYYTRGPPAHGEDMGYGYGHGQHHNNNITPGADNFSGSASGGMAGIAYNVADQNARESGVEAAQASRHLPPPPSRVVQGDGYSGGGGGYMYDAYGGRGGGASPMYSSQASSVHNLGHGSDPYADDPYHQGFSASTRSVDRRLGEVNPDEIEDDGDDGLRYHPKRSQRHSMLSSAANSDRGTKPAIGAAAAVAGAAAAGGAMGGLLRRNDGADFIAEGPEKDADWGKEKGMSKGKKWCIIITVALFIIGGVVGGVVGAMLSNRKNDKGKSSGESAKEDLNRNGDLDVDSDEIKELLNNPDLHKVFPGMDYTPLNTQYPDCLHNPPSQNNVTRDMAVLSQLTNRVRLYGTDCNQTQMVIHAIDQLNLKDDVKIWMGVWQDKNETTNKRQLDQMWTVLDKYGDEPFEGLIVANEILFREEMTITELGNLLDEVRTKLSDKSLNLPVATSDLGDDWTSALGLQSDYIMSNIHPFFAGQPAEKAAAWTMSFWENNNGGFFKSDVKKNIISETGWPTGGGTNCGAEGVTDCPNGSVAGIDELNTFMGEWICPALENGTNYFWFSAFDEPWKIRFNEKGKEWEDKWGLMDVNRNLKSGVEIPDCGGKTVS